jgi:cell division protein FtsQ
VWWVPAARKPTSRPAVLALPSRRPAVPVSLVRFLPSGRSLLIGFGLIALAAGGYLVARETSLFAVRRVEVTGARPIILQRVDEALAPLAGKSLLAVNAAAIARDLEGLPDVKLIAYDRAFPNTVRIVVSAERPVAVLRSGSEFWLISERGRVLRKLGGHPRSRLPRIWVAGTSIPSDGGLLSQLDTLRPALALGQVLSADTRLFGQLGEGRSVDGEVVLVLRGGTELRLGAGDDLPLQLAVARRVLNVVPPGARYVDVSVPERPVVAQ